MSKYKGDSAMVRLTEQEEKEVREFLEIVSRETQDALQVLNEGRAGHFYLYHTLKLINVLLDKTRDKVIDDYFRQNS